MFGSVTSEEINTIVEDTDFSTLNAAIGEISLPRPSAGSPLAAQLVRSGTNAAPLEP